MIAQIGPYFNPHENGGLLPEAAIISEIYRKSTSFPRMIDFTCAFKYDGLTLEGSGIMPIAEGQKQDCLAWYSKNKELYRACGDAAQRLLTALTGQAGIPVHSIQYRIKEQDSFLKKCQSERYTDPTKEITDVCGLRIIAFTNDDVERICAIIKDQFTIDVDNSVNKAELLQTNEVGYLSVHYIVRFNDTRRSLAEYARYSDLRFEIQVRTLLQHAWAEIEHDRSYKFGGELPKEIKRRFYLVAGTLELLDREFNLLAREIETYAKEVHEEAKEGNLDFDIDSTSLMEYLKVRLKDRPQIEPTFNGGDKTVVQELKDCGICTIQDLDRLLTDDLLDKLGQLVRESEYYNYAGFIRHILMVCYPDVYFDKAWKKHWSSIKSDRFKLLTSINPALKKKKHLLDVG